MDKCGSRGLSIRIPVNCVPHWLWLAHLHRIWAPPKLPISITLEWSHMVVTHWQIPINPHKDKNYCAVGREFHITTPLWYSLFKATEISRASTLCHAAALEAKVRLVYIDRHQGQRFWSINGTRYDIVNDIKVMKSYEKLTLAIMIINFAYFSRLSLFWQCVVSV